MINLKLLSNNKLLLSVMLLLATNNTIAAEITVTGTIGKAGGSSNGGDSGKSGGVGGVADAIANTVTLTNEANATGGGGGNGGSGVDGTTVKSFNGGHGGAGGDANADAGTRDILTGDKVEVKAIARGGIGGGGGGTGTRIKEPPRISRPSGVNGNGAKGGRATANAIASTIDSKFVNVRSQAIGGLGGTAGGSPRNATAGTSGDGGNAFATATVNGVGSATVQDKVGNNIIVEASATGGIGGRGIGFKNEELPSGRGVAGSGGRATASASAFNSIGSASVKVIQAGGRGGKGSITGKGGDGANSILINAINGEASEKLTLSQNAFGGAAGNSSNSGGDPGLAGNAVSSLTLKNITAKEVFGKSFAGGGSGGQGHNSHGSDAGSATATINLVTSSDKVEVVAEALGRFGGSRSDARIFITEFLDESFGSGGDGGNVSLGGKGGVYGQSTSGGIVNVSGLATGGSGGSFSIHQDIHRNSVGNVGNAGNGASVNLDDSVDGDTTGSLFLEQEAIGGNAGAGRKGIAGTASSILTKSTSSADLTLTAKATGGDGGYGSDRSVTPTDGANAWVEITGNNKTGALRINGEAKGGIGGKMLSKLDSSRGKGGDAKNIISGQNFGNKNQELIVSGSAIGGHSGFISRTSALDSGGNNGGNAFSSSKGAGRGEGRVFVQSLARGGAGKIGGNATSISQAVSAALVQAVARSEGGESRSKAGSANAFSSATGVSGKVGADAQSILRGNVTLRASVSADVAGDASGSSGGSVATSSARAVTSIGDALPDFKSLSNVQSLASNIVTGFTDKRILMAGILGVGYSENGSGIEAKYNSSISLKIDMNGKANTDLLMGLYGFSVTGDHGFDVLNFDIRLEGSPVENITFNDLATAEIYFNDNIFNFGRWDGLISNDNLLDIRISLKLTEQHLGQGFSTQFATAASTAVVPIPAAIWLFGSGMLGLLTFARRRK